MERREGWLIEKRRDCKMIRKESVMEKGTERGKGRKMNGSTWNRPESLLLGKGVDGKDLDDGRRLVEVGGDNDGDSHELLDVCKHENRTRESCQRMPGLQRRMRRVLN
jgi:hypothetical protein